ncbi:MAG: alpha/beta fold hydrolase [Bacteroidota bacterium]
MSTLKIVVIIAVALYLTVGAFVYFLQESLIFLPVQLPRDFEYEFNTEFEEHFIQMEDGAEINALHFKHADPKGLILYFHGNAGSLERWGEIVYPFVEKGFEVLIIDYRGYGKSTGKRSRNKLLSDADAIYSFAQQLTSEDNIILFGRSLGSAFASYLAGKNSPSKVILETPFYSLEDVANGMLPIYPTSLLLRYQFKNHEFLKNAKAPVYIFHGTEDEVVPYSSGEGLYQSLVTVPSILITVEGGHHNDLDLFDEYWAQMEMALNE